MGNQLTLGVLEGSGCQPGTKLSEGQLRELPVILTQYMKSKEFLNAVKGANLVKDNILCLQSKKKKISPLKTVSLPSKQDCL